MKLPLLAGECAGDTGLQHVEGGALNAVAKEEALGTREAVEGGTGLAGAVSGGFGGLFTGRRRSVRFSLRQVLFPVRRLKRGRVPRPGGAAPWTPE